MMARGMVFCGRGWPAGVGLVILLGCDAYDPDLLQKSQGFAARRDAGSPPPASDCGERPELCNAADDDCDGKVDEGAEADCQFDHATAVCVSAGDCVIVECEGGYADCNRDRADGCEQRSDEIACGSCGKICPGENDGTTGGTNTGREPDSSGDDDAGVVVGPDPVCTPSAERCDDLDNDCDDKTDEGPVCAVAMCAASTPSYRGAGCDECVCGNCGTLVALCQNHPDASWATRCRALVECVVIHSRAGECPNADCYMGGAGPCADETNIAAGGVNATDTSQLVAGCAVGGTPAEACAAAVNYRDQCTTTACASSCSN